jgi:hypothetical protein
LVIRLICIIFAAEMLTLGEIQFGALMLTTVLTIDLASRSLKQVGKVYNFSRWLMVGAAMAIQECGWEGFDLFAMLRGWELARQT